MTFAELIAACRERAPKGCSWSAKAVFWHFAGSTETLEWVIYRADLGKHYTGSTPEAVLANAFPVMDIADGLALVGEPTDDDLAAAEQAQRDAEACAAEQDLLAMQVPK